MTIPVHFKRLHPSALLPLQLTVDSIGLDIFAHLLTETGRENTLLIPPGVVRAVPTGLLIEPPPNCIVQVVSRSRLALKSLFVANAPGIIDPGYRGELKVLLYNGGNESYYVKHAQRVAQLIFVHTEFLEAIVVEQLSPSERGDRGFGSTD